MAALDTFLAAALERIDSRHERRRLTATTLQAGGCSPSARPIGVHATARARAPRDW